MTKSVIITSVLVSTASTSSSSMTLRTDPRALMSWVAWLMSPPATRLFTFDSTVEVMFKSWEAFPLGDCSSGGRTWKEIIIAMLYKMPFIIFSLILTWRKSRPYTAVIHHIPPPLIPIHTNSQMKKQTHSGDESHIHTQTHTHTHAGTYTHTHTHTHITHKHEYTHKYMTI